MLHKLTINNVALIKNLEIDFCARLNILSGETGAGKSIIVDSLMLLLGARYDKSILRYGEESGFVEGVFDVNEPVAALLNEYGFDKEDTLIVCRKFYADGKNEIRLNGRIASTSTLKAITSVLVDIYGQNEYQSLSKTAEHLKILNYFVRKNANEYNKILADEFFVYQRINRELNVIGNTAERARSIDMLKFQIDEISRAKTYEAEEDELLQKRKIYLSVEALVEALSSVKQNIMYKDEASVLELISPALSMLGKVSNISKPFTELYERLTSVSIELEDIAQTASDLLDGLEFDSDALEKIEARLDLLRTLKRKYGTYKEMTAFLSNAQVQLAKLENGAYEYEKLLKQKSESAKKLYTISENLSKIRRDGAVVFEKMIESELMDLGMEGAQFKIIFSEFPSFDDSVNLFSASGLDKVEFYLSANAGQPIQPLIKIISGGEMSRFILALKVISSRMDDIPTMIFDEIDTGISGKIGQEIAKKLAVISRSHQVLCVTHLAQIASMADNHYYISKTSTSGDTITSIELLDSDAIIEEISRLSGAKDISEQSAVNARGMKEWSEKYKKGI